MHIFFTETINFTVDVTKPPPATPNDKNKREIGFEDTCRNSFNLQFNYTFVATR